MAVANPSDGRAGPGEAKRAPAGNVIQPSGRAGCSGRAGPRETKRAPAVIQPSGRAGRIAALSRSQLAFKTSRGEFKLSQTTQRRQY